MCTPFHHLFDRLTHPKKLLHPVHLSFPYFRQIPVAESILRDNHLSCQQRLMGYHAAKILLDFPVLRVSDEITTRIDNGNDLVTRMSIDSNYKHNYICL